MILHIYLFFAILGFVSLFAGISLGLRRIKEEIEGATKKSIIMFFFGLAIVSFGICAAGSFNVEVLNCQQTLNETVTYSNISNAVINNESFSNSTVTTINTNDLVCETNQLVYPHFGILFGIFLMLSVILALYMVMVQSYSELKP